MPVYGHRYPPADPALADDPVFSVHRTDVIRYASSLGLYLATEFDDLPWKDAVAPPARRIPFWSELVDGSFHHP